LSNIELQTKKPDEVIIVDASTTEETRLIMNNDRGKITYPIHYYEYYEHEKGLTLQRNYGISKAKFEIVGFLDDDSLLEPDYFERVNIFEEDVTGDIAGASGFILGVDFSQIVLIYKKLRDISSRDAFSKLMEKYFPAATTTYRSKIREGLEKILHLRSGEEGTYDVKRGKPIHLKTIFKGRKEVDFLKGIAFYRKEVFDYMKFSEFFRDYGYAEDLHFSLQVRKRFKLLVDGEAKSYHLYAPSGRPNLFELGHMTAMDFFIYLKLLKNVVS
jgi:glycosyltransferase involved in cell wall biosynthesis